jgi:hypothetical protein
MGERARTFAHPDAARRAAEVLEEHDRPLTLRLKAETIQY